MKKLFFVISVLFVSLCATAETTLTNGVYENTKVFSIEGVNDAETVFSRALEVLSDFTMTKDITESTMSTDQNNNHVKTIICKGKYYLGFHKYSTGYGMNTYADFTLKIRCKEDRFQIVINSGSMTFHWTADNMADETVPLCLILPEFTYKQHHMRIKKSALEFAPTIEPMLNRFMLALAVKIQSIADVDDF